MTEDYLLQETSSMTEGLKTSILSLEQKILAVLEEKSQLTTELETKVLFNVSAFRYTYLCFLSSSGLNTNLLFSISTFSQCKCAIELLNNDTVLHRIF